MECSTLGKIFQKRDKHSKQWVYTVSQSPNSMATVLRSVLITSSVDMSPAPTVAGFHVVAMNSCSAVKFSPNDTVGPCVSTMSSISPTNVESCVGVSPAPTTVVQTLDSNLSSTTFDLDQESASDDDHISLDSSFGGIGFVHHVQNQPPASWPMISRSRAISKSRHPRFSAIPTSATANALEILD